MVWKNGVPGSSRKPPQGGESVDFTEIGWRLAAEGW
jgi:hypothetical protein